MDIHNNVGDEYFDKIYNNYFGDKEQQPKELVEQKKDLSGYTYREYSERGGSVENTGDIPGSEKQRWLAEDNIDDVDELAEHIRQILNAAWGDNWGEFGPELKEGDNPENIQLPQITYDLVTRIIPDKKPIKPLQMDSVKELVNGVPTGDYFNLYSQWFDCVMEFNICGANSLETRKLMKKFETILATYTGHLKKVGASEILFLKEVHPTQSSNYREGIPMKCLLYLVRIERITVVKASTIRKMELALETANNAAQTSSAPKTYKL
jgi:hypothetical protein